MYSNSTYMGICYEEVYIVRGYVMRGYVMRVGRYYEGMKKEGVYIFIGEGGSPHTACSSGNRLVGRAPDTPVVASSDGGGGGVGWGGGVRG